MNTQKLSKILVFISIFPLWIFSKNVYLYDKFIFALPFVLIILIIYFFFENEKFKKNKLFILSLIICYGLDQNLLLENNFIKTNYNFLKFLNIYYFSIFTLIFLLFVCLTLFYYFKDKFIFLIFPFMIIIFIFNFYNIFFFPIKIQNFNNFENTNNKKIKKGETKVIFIILDEMSGINSNELKDISSENFKKNVFELAKKYNLNIYPNVYSLSYNTATSVPAIINFIDKNENLEKNRLETIKKNNLNLYNEYIVKKNQLFDRYQSISVFQNIHLNYCLYLKVTKCEQFNPYQTYNEYIEGYKFNYFTKFLSVWKIQGSITAKVLWRLGRELNLTDSYLEPEIHKARFNIILNKIILDLKSNDFDLIFAHLLVPHIPYGYNKMCKYDGKLSIHNTKWSKKKKYEQHNLERLCVTNYLEKFFSQISSEYLEIFIISDHGSRISNSYDSQYSSFFLYKKKNSIFFINHEKKSIQKFIRDIFKLKND